jgi:hypothetical protein
MAAADKDEERTTIAVEEWSNLTEGLLEIRPPYILTVSDLVPDPLEGSPIWTLLARRQALR